MRDKQITIAVITRLHFEPGDPAWEQRLALFRVLTLPCIANQTIRNFTYYVICHPGCKDQIAALNPKITPLPWPIFPSAFGQDINYNELIPPHNLQVSIDSDDLVSPGYLRRLLQEVKLCKSQQVITFIPVKFSLLHTAFYEMTEAYGGEKASPFYSLYNPIIENFYSIYNFNHFNVPKELAPVRLIQPGYCSLVVHEHNWITRLVPNKGKLSIDNWR